MCALFLGPNLVLVCEGVIKMDEVVKLAMAKWPNVPHCTGWLALDARGNWRMRDERAQAQDSPGEKIVHPALIGFIHRNYGRDERACWYFQNGPQRVYVDLATTPYIVHTDPHQGFVDQTGQHWPSLDAVWMTEKGQLVLQASHKIGMVDDRDIAQCLPDLQIGGAAVSDDTLMAWLAGPMTLLVFHHAGRFLPVQLIREDELAARFEFVKRPRNP